MPVSLYGMSVCELGNEFFDFDWMSMCVCVCVCGGGGWRGGGEDGAEEGRGGGCGGLIILGCCPQMSREWWTFFWVGVIWVMVGMWISVADHM